MGALMLGLLFMLTGSAPALAADPSLKAAFGFEEPSGAMAIDASGTGNEGTLTGPARTAAGRFGSALSFDGVDDIVTVPDSDSLDLAAGMTLEGWFRPTELGRWRNGIIKEAATSLAYAMYPETSSAQPRLVAQIAGRLRETIGPSQLPINTWTHMAATYDGAIFRLYVNGAQVATSSRSGILTATTGPLRIGGTLVYPEYFKGMIDEVRVYNRALLPSEIVTDMNTPVAGGPDTVPPSAPGAMVRTGSSPTSIDTSWGESIDNRGVAAYDVYRDGVKIGSTQARTYAFTGLTCATSYTLGVEARDEAGNVSPRVSLTTATNPCDSTPPQVSVTAPSAGATVSGNVSLTADATDNDQVSGVQFLVDGQPIVPEDTSAPFSVAWNSRSAANGPHAITARARDRSSNQTTSVAVTVTVDNAAASAPGLVLGFGFDEGLGVTATDASGNGNDGTIGGATWSTAGRIGGALSFDGIDDQVTVIDRDSLDLSNGMTLSAWVKPDVLNGAWRTVAFKEDPSSTTRLSYALYAQEGQPVPTAEITTGGAVGNARGALQLPLGAWTHLAMTYDGANLRLYVDGNLVRTTARTGPMPASTGPLRIGGNSVWGERFSGLIDELRVYNQALPQADIQADMNASVATPDTTPPSAPTGLTATDGLGSVNLAWNASTDDVGVVRYNVHRATTSGFTPTTANRIAQPTATTYRDSGLSAGTYFYKVTAEDRPRNVSAPSNQASGTAAADTTAPTVSVTAPAAGGPALSGTVPVTASATDDDAVAGVQFLLDDQPLGTEDLAAPYTVSWNTRTATNTTHQLKARARDASGNLRTSAAVSVTVDNTNAPPPGMVAAYGFDEGSGPDAGDSSGAGNTGTVTGATWAPIGRFGGALNFDGINDWVTVPDADQLDVSGAMTVSAWVRPDALPNWRTLFFKEKSGGIVYGIYAAGGDGFPATEITPVGSTKVTVARGTAALPTDSWSHVAATYDGLTLKLFVDGTLVGSTAKVGSITTSNGVLRIGGNETWGEYFDGIIDEVRVYDRPLSGEEIQTDMLAGVARDTVAPTVATSTPAHNATGLGIAPPVTATFSEAMDPGSISSSTFLLKDSFNADVPATVTYNEGTGKATLKPVSALHYGTRYTATLKGGSSGARVKDRAGNALAADKVWSFETEPAPPPILVVDAAVNPYSSYVPEILRAEGMNEFSSADVSLVDRSFLNNFDVVVLGQVPVTATQATALADWVAAGGNLIALRPDKRLAGLLGLTDTGGTLSEGYLEIDASRPPGEGIVGEPVQFHGTADRYTLSGATAVATLFSDSTTPTVNPAVSLRNVGTVGGQAAAFTFDLARSTTLTRQGNPAWAGMERDGITGVRTNDLFYGASVTDPQPDWVDLNKIHIPQADELQRLLANLITEMNADRRPLPRFWYLPRGEKAAVVMTGDDHAQGGTAGRFNHYKAMSPAGCSVEQWECVRSTSYIYAPSPITNAEAAAFEAEGFEVALHVTRSGGCAFYTPTTYATTYRDTLAAFAASYPGVPAPTTERTHCVGWSDYDSQPKVQLSNGIRLDTNYYHYTESWAGFPGFMTGSGLPQRFVDRDGNTIDVYQAATQMQDEPSTPQPYPATIDALLGRALGPEGYYGAFVANMHTDKVTHAGSDAIVASAQSQDVPIISARQLLRWTDGRNDSTFRTFAWDGTTLTFTVRAGTGATGLRGMVPTRSGTKTLSSISRNGTSIPFSVQIIKGVEYAFFAASDGVHEARYS
jgi:hypothetical protein